MTTKEAKTEEKNGSRPRSDIEAQFYQANMGKKLRVAFMLPGGTPGQVMSYSGTLEGHSTYNLLVGGRLILKHAIAFLEPVRDSRDDNERQSNGRTENQASG